MMTVNRDVILKTGYAKSVKAGIEPFLTHEEIARIYQEKMLAYGRDCGYTFTEDEVSAYIEEQMANIDYVQTKNDVAVEMRFQ